MASKIILPKQKQASLSKRGFLERAFMWLDSDLDLGIFYAAMELQKCFECIWLDHSGASEELWEEWDTVNNLNSQPEEIMSRLNREFVLELSFNKSYKFTLNPSDPNLTLGYFLMMPDSLFETKQKVSRFTHIQWPIPIGAPNRHWYYDSRVFLLEFANNLIPHTSSKNSLLTATTPDVHVIEVDTDALETFLRTTVKDVKGPWN